MFLTAAVTACSTELRLYMVNTRGIAYKHMSGTWTCRGIAFTIHQRIAKRDHIWRVVGRCLRIRVNRFLQRRFRQIGLGAIISPKESGGHTPICHLAKERSGLDAVHDLVDSINDALTRRGAYIASSHVSHLETTIRVRLG